MSGTWKVSSGGWSSGVSARAKPTEPTDQSNSPRRPQSPLLRPPSPLCRGAAPPTSFGGRSQQTGHRQSALRGSSPLVARATTTEHPKGIVPPQAPWAKVNSDQVVTNSRVSFTFQRDFLHKGPATISDFADEEEYARKTLSRWVTVYSLDSGDTLLAIQYLTAVFGPVKRYHWPAAGVNCNWLHVEFFDPVAASAALTQHLVTMEVASSVGAQLVEFAVETCREHNIMDSFLEEDLQDFRTQLSFVASDSHEDAAPRPSNTQEPANENVSGEFEVPRHLTAAGRLSQVQQKAKNFRSERSRSVRAEVASPGSSSVSRSDVLGIRTLNGSVSRGVHSGFSIFGGVTSTATTNQGCSRGTSRAAMRNKDVPVPAPESSRTHATAADLWCDLPLVPRILSAVAEQLMALTFRNADVTRVRRRAVAERINQRSEGEFRTSDADATLVSAENESDVEESLLVGRRRCPLYRKLLRMAARSLRRHFVYRLPQRETVCSPSATSSNVYIVLHPRSAFATYEFWSSAVLLCIIAAAIYMVALYPILAMAADWLSEARVVLFGQGSSASGGSFYYYTASAQPIPGVISAMVGDENLSNGY